MFTVMLVKLIIIRVCVVKPFYVYHQSGETLLVDIVNNSL